MTNDEPKTWTVYKLYCTAGGVYYGSTCNLKRRLTRHRNDPESHHHPYDAYEIVSQFDNKEDARRLEDYLIANFECVNKNRVGTTTEAQKEAHRKYNAEHRKQQREYARERYFNSKNGCKVTNQKIKRVSIEYYE